MSAKGDGEMKKIPVPLAFAVFFLFAVLIVVRQAAVYKQYSDGDVIVRTVEGVCADRADVSTIPPEKPNTDWNLICVLDTESVQYFLQYSRGGSNFVVYASATTNNSTFVARKNVSVSFYERIGSVGLNRDGEIFYSTKLDSSNIVLPYIGTVVAAMLVGFLTQLVVDITDTSKRLC